MEHTETPVQKQHFWALPLRDVFEVLQSSEKGLSTTEVGQRLKIFGKNVISFHKKRSGIIRFIGQFKNPLIGVLLFAGAITIALNDYHDAIFIFATALINAGLGFYQESKAERAVEGLRSYLSATIRVTRDGLPHEVETAELVPGDIIHLRQGDRVPADARIISENEFRVDQSVLTGEPLPVTKTTQEVPLQAALGDRTSMIFAGTLVTQGVANAVVTATDASTEFGSIARAVNTTALTETPLQAALRRFTLRAGFILAALSISLFFVAISEGIPTLDAFLITVAILVAAVPEGLPIVTTVILAIGVERLAKKKGVVRRLSAAETLGSTSVILTDKTGTLTQAKMSLANIIVFESDPELKNTVSQEEFLLHTALLNVDAVVENPHDHFVQWQLSGKPLEVALVRAAAERGVHFPTLKEGKEMVRILPFNSKNKFSASVYTMPDGWFKNRFNASKPHVMSVLGAPDILLKLCSPDPTTREMINETIKARARDGERVVGVAVKEVTNPKEITFDNETHLHDMRFLGLLCFKDPLRPGTARAIASVQKEGIRVIILTGDHEETAGSVARELGLNATTDTIIRGEDLELLPDEALRSRLATATVIARVSPNGKLRVARILREQGEIVAMTGDGINDAPALREAHIGIAMGSGTDVSREVADLVLLDDNFTTIITAINEGKRILSNIRKAIVYMASTVLDTVILIGGSIVAGLVVPVNPLQILWINFFTGSFPGIALAFEPAADKNHHAHSKEVRSRTSILTSEVRFLIFVNGTLSSIFLFATYSILLHLGFDPAIVQTFTFAVLGTYSLCIVLALRNLKASIFTYNPFSNKALTGSIILGWSLILAAIYVPFLRDYLGTTALPPIWLLSVVAFGIFNTLIVEVSKFLFRHES